jgi:rhomboid protease GluP
MASASFGKRGVARPVPQDRVRAVEPAAGGGPTWLEQSRIPFASLGILLLLGAVFAIELLYAKPEAPYTPSLDTLIALGGVGRKLVIDHQQWWRLFTAPLMHGSLDHLVSNAIALLLAGWLLEPLIGRAWYTAIFAIGALAGSIGSLLMSDVLVSIGASGAIMALLAAVLVWCVPFEDRVRGKRLRRAAIWMFVSALLPAAGSHIDLGAHAGGAVAGGVMGFVLQIMWPEAEERPGHQSFASAIAAAGLAAAFLSFLLIAIFPTPDVGQQRLPALIPASELPQSADEGMRKSRELVRRYPDDPRGHMLRALSFLRLDEITEAQAELRLAMAKSQAPGMEAYRIKIRLILAVTMTAQNRIDDAKAILEPGDCKIASQPNSDGLGAAYRRLRQTGVCR